MPTSGGLPDVSQKISVDPSEAIAGYEAVAGKVKEYHEITKVATLATRDFSDELQKIRSNLNDFGSINFLGSPSEWREASDAAREALAVARDYGSEMDDLGSSVEDFSEAHADAAELVRDTAAAVGEHTVALQEMVRVQQRATESVSDHVTVVDQASDSHQDASDSAAVYAENLARLEVNARNATIALAETAATAAAVSASSYGAYDPNAVIDLQGGLSSSVLRAIQADIASRRYYSIGSGIERGDEGLPMSDLPARATQEAVTQAIDWARREAAANASYFATAPAPGTPDPGIPLVTDQFRTLGETTRDAAAGNIDFGGSLRDIGQAMDDLAASEGFASYRELVGAASGPRYDTGPFDSGWWPRGNALADVAAQGFGYGEAAGGIDYGPGGPGGGGPPGGPPGGGGDGGDGGGGGFGGAVLGASLAGLGHEVRADATWDTVAGFIGTWYPRIHYAMMAINEVLATAGPALVAAGTAVAVGTQGGQTLYSRLKAINDVSQSLGPSLGQTSGSFLGIGSGLQTAQNLADTSVWELFGAGLRSVQADSKTGVDGLNSFWQMGINTIDMMDRFGAGITKDFQEGLGDKLGAVVNQGTSDLQQFGDVIGNVGHLAMNVIPALPGVGGDILTTLNAGTKGLADAAGFLNSTGLLGPLLAFEAASRYGPTLVGATGALSGRIGAGLTAGSEALGEGALATGLGSAGRFFGQSAVAATAEDVAAAGGEAAAGFAVGDMIGGEGIAGALGGLSATSIGAIAASTFLLGKLFTTKSPAQSYVSGITGPLGSAPVGYMGIKDIVADANVLQKSLPGALSGANMVDEAAKAAIQGTVTHPSASLLTAFGLNIGTIGGGTRMSGSREAAGAEAAEKIVGTSGVSSAYSQGMQQLAGYMTDTMKAGEQVSKLFGVSLPEAFALTAQSGLQLNTAFGKDGMLNSTSLEQIVNMQAGYKAMNESSGVMAKSIGAVQATSGLAATNINSVNSAWDTITQNASSGISGAVGFASSLANLQSLGSSLPKAQAQADAAKLAPASKESTAAIAEALSGFSSAASQSAWSAFSNTSSTSPGLIQQLGTFQDSLRLAQTSGVLSQAQVTAASMYQAKELLPYAKDSTAATAQLSIAAQAAGYNGPVDNYKDLKQYVDENAASTENYNKILTKQSVGMSDVSKQASNFGATMNNDVFNAMASAGSIIPEATKNMTNFSKSLDAHGAGTFSGSALMSTVKDFVQLGASAASIRTLMGAVVQQHGITGAAAAHIEARVTADTSAAQAAINGIHGKDVKVNVMSTGEQAAQAAIDAMHGKVITITEILKSIGSLTVPAGGGPASGTITGGGGGMRLTNSATGMRVPGFGGGDIFPAMLEPGEAVVPKHLVGMVAPLLAMHGVPGFAAGGLVGSDMMDVFSVARNLTTSALGGGSMSGQQWQNVFASLMKAAMVARQMQTATGFAAGGIASGDSVPWLPEATYEKLYTQYEAYKNNTKQAGGWYDTFDQWYTATDAGKNQIGIPGGSSSSSGSTSVIAKDFAFTLTGQIADAVKSSSQASTIANALITKIGTEIAYAKNVSSAAQTGQGYGTGGLLGTLTATAGPSGAGAIPPGHPGYNAAAWNAATTNAANDTAPAQSVQQQMQSYLGTVNSFTKDLHTLTKEGLSKSLISQLIAAGPTQGDALAQSIMGDPSGVKGANSLWVQIEKASNKLGAQSAMSEYGGFVSGNLRSASASSNNISININAGSGAGSSGLSLSASQIKVIVEEVQAALLKQAKRNNKTGLKLTGKGS